MKTQHNALMKEVAEIRRVQERQTVVLARIETKLEGNARRPPTSCAGAFTRWRSPTAGDS